MENKTLFKSAVLALVIIISAVAFCEIHLRNKGITVSYDDGPSLWSDQRAMVYEPADKTIVFIGSSRIKYDLDIATWENKTHIHAVQLAIEGSCPRPILEDLANDPNFKGRLIIDVTEGLFFSNAPPNVKMPIENVKYFHDRTPAQQLSFLLNRPLEDHLVFLDRDNFSLNAQLDAIELPSRLGVFMMPIFPLDFGRTTFERQAYMTKKFTSDSVQENQVKAIWHFFSEMSKKAPPMAASDLANIFESVKVAIDKIKARGGEVLFVRTPSSGVYLQGERMAFPREKYWNKLLGYTNCRGIHFEDFLALDHFVCPEFSHLSRPDAIVFTYNFIEILGKEKGWELPVSTK